MVSGKLLFSELTDEEMDGDIEEEEEKKRRESLESESFETLLKIEDENGLLQSNKKNKKKVKTTKYGEKEINLSGPIKVEIDLNAETLKAQQKVKLEEINTREVEKSTGTQNILDDKSLGIGNFKLEAIPTDIPKNKLLENPNLGENKIKTESLPQKGANPYMFQNPYAHLFPQTALPNMMPMMTNPSMMPPPLNNPFNFAQSFQERHMKNMLMMQQHPMNYMSFMENQMISNPFLYQEYMNLCMENLKKMYPNNFK